MADKLKYLVRNTTFLYLRMVVLIGISFYAVRVLLTTLGPEDFGLFHVIFGIVMLCGFVRGALTATTQRFLTFELGNDKGKSLNTIFSMCINIHIVAALLIFLIAGGVGSILVPKVLSYEPSQSSSLLTVYWCVLLTFTFNFLASPYQSLLIAFEKMSIFSLISVTESILKLVIIFLIPFMPIKELVAYALLLVFVSIVVSSLYIYCGIRIYSDYKYELKWDYDLFRRLISFSGWSMWANSAFLLSNHGVTVLINVFFGPTLNAAKAIGNQISAALDQLVSNLQMAIRPQIVKSYSSNDSNYNRLLVNYSSKYNFFFIYIAALPIFFRSEDVLNLWLANPPPHSAEFLRLILINVVLGTLSSPLESAAQATGRIGLYQFASSGILLCNLPVSFVVLSYGFDASSVFVVQISLTVVATFLRVMVLRRIYDFSIRFFLIKAIFPIITVLLASSLTMKVTNSFFAEQLSLVGLMSFVLINTVFTLLAVWFLGMEQFEKQALRKIILNKIRFISAN